MEPNTKLIGAGTVSKIYAQGTTAYKTYPIDYPLEWVASEVRIQQEIIEHTNLCIPKMKLLKNSKEIEMDYIQGCTLADRMRKEKYKFALEDLIDVQLSIYEYSNLELDQAHDIFEKRIKESELEEEYKLIGLSALAKIEKKTALCHFDIHFLNIMYDHSEYYIIDWVNAMLGNPVMDIARTYVILKQYAQRMANKYLKLISKKGGYELEEIKMAIPLMAILRMLETDAESYHENLMPLLHI